MKTLKEIFHEKIIEVIEPTLFDHGNSKKKTVTREKYDEENYGYSWNISDVENELRQEAIKYIKHFQGFKRITEFDDGAINFIKVFFNLTEEDLQ